MREIYVLDDNFSDYAVIDAYESSIWTERFDELGDFELHMPADETYRRLLVPGTVISIDDSYRMMSVETVDEESVDDGWKFVFRGKSLESVLANRVGRTSPSGSPKTWINRLSYQALTLGLYSIGDQLNGIVNGLGKIYPPSNIPPAFQNAPYSGSGWVGLMDAYGQARDLGPLGFRIIRVPHTTQLYFETYTGIDRTSNTKIDISGPVKALWPNPYLFETDEDVVVWRNIAFSSGFDKGIRPLSVLQLPYGERNGVTPSEVECSWSKSGKGLKIDSPADRPNNRTLAILTHETANLADNWIDGPLAGKTLTLSAKIEIKQLMNGTEDIYSRTLMVSSAVNGSAETFLASVKAPNVIGVHPVSITFTLPAIGNAQGHNRWTAYVCNGNGIADDGVIWGDLCLFEHPSNPVGYFDGANSPDTDLTPAWNKWTNPFGWTHEYSVLTGKKIQNTYSTDGVFIQSKAWGIYGDMSGRMIRNVSTGPTQRVLLDVVYPSMTAKRAQATVYQSAVLTGTTTQLGSVEIQRNGTIVSSTSQKTNVVGSSVKSLSTSTYLTEVYLRGGYTQLGGSLWWDGIFVGSASTWSPPMIEPVIFTESMDDFIVDRSHISISNHKSVAYVTHGETLLEVDDGYAQPGLKRRVIHVDAEDLDDGPNLGIEMIALGVKALSENRRVSMIDGEVPGYSRYVYDVDYSLGDLVFVENRGGEKLHARVAEHIFVSDKEGSRSYPTLREEPSSALGSWNAPEYNIHWIDAEPLGTWSMQP